MGISSVFNLLPRFMIIISLAVPYAGVNVFGRLTNAPQETYTVTNTEDSGAGSLRWAIQQANGHAGPDLIAFNIPYDAPGCSIIQQVCAIAPDSPLPALSGGGTTIDGYTQPGSEYATASEPAVLAVWLKGDLAGDLANGLLITSADNRVTGLRIDRFGINGIMIYGTTADNNRLWGNHVGVDRGNTYDGVFIGGGASGNLIGGDAPGEINVLSGNGWDGVDMFGAGTDGNIVSGNLIGVDASAETSMENGFYGVRIYGGAKNNRVGGNNSGERNLISGNTYDGVRIIGAGTSQNVVAGNYIGSDAIGTSPLGNNNGVFIGTGAQYNTIGGSVPGASNLISGNISTGVVITGTNTMSNTVIYNRIGTDANGLIALGNDSGMDIYGGASFNHVGGDSASERNLISGNISYGIKIREEQTESNVVTGNYIGVNASGTAAMANGIDGISIRESGGNRIGGAAPGEGNVISGNGQNGIYLLYSEGDNLILGNIIGLDAAGTQPLGNGSHGVIFNEGDDDWIGGDTPAEGNLISANGGCGIRLHESYSIRIRNNRIGVDISATEDLGNGSHGISLDGDSEDNYIGSQSGGGNLISGNQGDGVNITFGSYGTRVRGNHIGSGADESIDLGNSGNGVTITGGAYENSIEAENVILYNTHGVMITGEGTTENVVESNRIVQANFHGVLIDSGATNNRIGPDNLIQDNPGYGVWIAGGTTTGNVVTRNSISSNANGIQLDGGANNHVGTPTIHLDLTGTTVSVFGMASIGSLVEIFGNWTDSEGGEGLVYLGEAITDADNEYLWETGAVIYPFLSATATDQIDGTSEFSETIPNPYRFVFLPMVRRP